MKLEELHAKLSSLIEQCQTVMAACATMMEEEKGGPGSGRKPGSGKPKEPVGRSESRPMDTEAASRELERKLGLSDGELETTADSIDMTLEELDQAYDGLPSRDREKADKAREDLTNAAGLLEDAVSDYANDQSSSSLDRVKQALAHINDAQKVIVPML